MDKVTEPTFKLYGKVLADFDFENYVKTIDNQKIVSIPDDGNNYLASIQELEETSLFSWLKENVFGGLEIQLGTCAGHNTVLSAVEYHQGSEVVIALTDCLLTLGHVSDLDGLYYDAELMKSFVIRKGEAVELFSTTLHYSPIQLDLSGYATIVGLLKGTNDSLDSTSENQMLLAKNKFMIVHSSRKDKIEKGAFPGFYNKNIDFINV